MEPEKSLTSRRDFVAKAAAAVAAVPALGSLGACAPAAPAPAPTAAPTPAAPAGAQGAAQPDPEVDALMEILRARYGSRLTPEQLREVREGVVGNVRAAKQLHDYRISMHVEPSWTVAAYRREGR